VGRPFFFGPPRLLKEGWKMPCKAESLPTLAAHGLIGVRTVLEVVPQLLPAGVPAGDATFTATVVSTRGRQDAVRWQRDGQLYSLTALTGVLYQRHGVQWPGKTCVNWRRRGQAMTLWDEAEQYAR
jgi:hypothetical protein